MNDKKAGEKRLRDDQKECLCGRLRLRLRLRLALPSLLSPCVIPSP